METTTATQNQQELPISFDETISEMVQLLSSFDEKKFNTIPFEGSWTVGQVGEHLLKSGFGIAQILKGNTRPAERPIDEKLKSLQAIFLDFSRKDIAAEVVTPSDEPKEKENLIGALKEKMEEIRELAEEEDLSLICMDFPFPGLGEMTRWEWINMIMDHTKRHIYQTKNIYKRINKIA